MDSYEEFEQDLNRMPTDRRSSQNATMDAHNASAGHSNLLPIATRQSALLPESFNASGRPFNISEFATRPVAPQLQPPDMYNAFGRPIQLSDFAGGRSGSLARGMEQRSAIGGSRNLTEIPVDPTLDQRQVSTSGRAHAELQDLNSVPGCPLYSSNLPPNGHDSGQANLDTLSRANLSNLAGSRSTSVQQPRSQTLAFSSADRWTPARRMDSREVDSYNRKHLRCILAPMSPFNVPSFCGESPFVMTTKPQRMCSKDPPFRDQSGREFARDREALDSGQQAPRISTFSVTTGESLDKVGLFDTPSSFHMMPPPQESHSVTATRQCPVIPEDKLISFLQCGGIKGGPPTRHPLFHILVRDTYYPGVIDDSVNGKVDFNAIAFDHAFGSRPIPDELDAEEVPMSLLQAFEERLNYEDDLRAGFKRRWREFCLDDVAASLQPQSNEEDHAPRWSHRDELKLASTVDIDLATGSQDQPETGLTTALACLAKAEKMNNFDKSVHRAEEAIRHREKDTPPEKAALKSSCSFHINMQKDEAKTEKTSYNPIEIISYVGTTKPREV